MNQTHIHLAHDHITGGRIVQVKSRGWRGSFPEVGGFCRHGNSAGQSDPSCGGFVPHTQSAFGAGALPARNRCSEPVSDDCAARRRRRDASVGESARHAEGTVQDWRYCDAQWLLLDIED